MCSSSSCDTNYYATDSSVSANCFDSTCSTNNGNYTCDPKVNTKDLLIVEVSSQVYVSWIGTDANGLKMESAGNPLHLSVSQQFDLGLRISMFRQYSIGDLYASAQKIIADQYNSTTKTYDCKVAGTCSQKPSWFMKSVILFDDSYGVNISEDLVDNNSDFL